MAAYFHSDIFQFLSRPQLQDTLGRDDPVPRVEHVCQRVDAPGKLLDAGQTPHPEGRSLCRQRDHALGIGSEIRGLGQPDQLGAHHLNRDPDRGVIGAGSVYQHGLTGRFAQEHRNNFV